jgi:hypothetical protein
MENLKYMFMFCVEGCDPQSHRAAIAAPGVDMTIVGVSDHEQACELVRAARDAGTVDFIELCGGFGEEGCRRVIEAVGGALPVGYTTYLPEEQLKFDAMVESWRNPQS